MSLQPPPARRAASDGPRTLRAFCLRVLESGDLESKLAAPQCPDGTPLSDASPGPVAELDWPARSAGLRMQAGGIPLPRPGALREVEHRRTCLSRFAHHELMAVEFFAWALVRWPELPAELRRGLLAALIDEQRHCRLYLERLHDSGGSFETDDHSDYFWQQAKVILGAASPPKAFLAVMGLTLEQANLDFTLTYRDAFREGGDPESAAVCQLVHDEEIAHVALATRWLARLDDASEDSARSDLDRYLEAVPFPMGPARAKGRRFEVGPRRRAGLSETMIEFVRAARSTQETGRPNS